MKVGYTEFSFGYAFTENLIRSSSAAPVGAPVFPNLIQEGHSGFDIRINFPGVPLFFQYKLPELMKRGTAFEIASGHSPGLSIPFFRIAMMRRDVSRQHELLLRLEARYPSNVFYAAPCIANMSDFDRSYNGATVARQSIFVSPGDIGPLPDDKAYSLAYKPGLATGYFARNPSPPKFKHLMISLRSLRSSSPRSVLRKSARRRVRCAKTYLSLLRRQRSKPNSSLLNGSARDAFRF
ncbi:hypothetical protein [Mesorhizobium sp. M0778]|uniref:hypothetical protein n=1 Tax=Mesorhizobium sp. M0778 TaxID=2956999 RepID=UPI00333C081D